MWIQPDHLITLPHSFPEDLNPWLQHKNSLTEKLRAEAGEARLELLQQQWAKTSWWERFVLNVTTKSVLRREILMSARQVPCWYGRTIIPDYAYEAQPSFFECLQQKPLGELVFKEAKANRTILFDYPINFQCIEYHWLSAYLDDKDAVLGGRLSVFNIDNYIPFYLVEVLFPGFLRILN